MHRFTAVFSLISNMKFSWDCALLLYTTVSVGQLPQAVLLITNLKEAEVQKHYPHLRPGGHWKPEDCITEHKVIFWWTISDF